MTAGSLPDLLPVIQQHTTLKKAGGQFVGLCPLHQEKTPSFSVNPDKGVWHCFGCGKGGDVITFIEELHQVDYPRALEILGIGEEPHRKKYLSKRQHSLQAARQAFGMAPAAPGVGNSLRPAITPMDEKWRRHLEGLLPLDGSPALDYLCSRGLDHIFTTVAGVKYHPSWYNKGAAVIFPIRDAGGQLVAAQGRFLDEAVTPKAMTAGRKSDGVFFSPEAMAQRAVLVTEAPIDSLSLAMCGYPSIALVGTSFPAWLPQACIGKEVYIALDDDQAGDTAAGALCAALIKLGIVPQRLKPRGAKDWNELLQRVGWKEMRAIIAQCLPTTGGARGRPWENP
ncbi:MAG: CHC2 zinc finger domain-containing protein [Armatimonadota bacterium]